MADIAIIIAYLISPDRNGYPATGMGKLWREEYEWIAGKSS